MNAMSDVPVSVLAALGAIDAYLLGAIPFGYVVVRLVRRADIRTLGSGNIGATNVGRVLGKRYGVLVLLLDVLKGYVPAALGLPALTGFNPDIGRSEDWLPAALGLCAVAGHVWPVYLGFRGGKGVATVGGVFLGLAPVAVAATFGLWFVVALMFRYISLASMAAAFGLPIAVAFLDARPLRGHLADFGLACVAGAFVLGRHRSNLGRILSGTEPKIGRRRAAASVEEQAAGAPAGERGAGADSAPSAPSPDGGAGSGDVE